MSTLRTNTLQNAAGSKSVPVDTVVDGTAKAWVNFNGTGTVAIRAAFNVSSITDNNVGDYTVNFSTAMPDANYAVAALGRNNTDNTGLSGCTVDSNLSHTRTASAFGIQTKRGSTAMDSTEVTLAIFR